MSRKVEEMNTRANRLDNVADIPVLPHCWQVLKISRLPETRLGFEPRTWVDWFEGEGHNVLMLGPPGSGESVSGDGDLDNTLPTLTIV
jgi:hypothetical protein